MKPAMGAYPALETFFADGQPLSEGRTTELRVAIEQGLNAALYEDPKIKGLALDVRRCVADAGKFFPESLGDNPVATETMVAILNERTIRPVLDMAWDRRKQRVA